MIAGLPLQPVELVWLGAGGCVPLDHQQRLLPGRGLQPVCGAPALHAAPHAPVVCPHTRSLYPGGSLPFLLPCQARHALYHGCTGHVLIWTHLLLTGSLQCCVLFTFDTCSYASLELASRCVPCIQHHALHCVGIASSHQQC